MSEAENSARRSRIPPLAVTLAAIAVFGLTALAVNHTQTPEKAYFDVLAEAFLSGRLDLENPPHTSDLTPHDGRWYVPFPPLPALLLTAALLFERQVNVVWFSGVLAAVGVGLLYAALARVVAARHPSSASDSSTTARGNAISGWSGLSRGADGSPALWTAAMVAFSTPLWWVAIDGNVWFFAQTCVFFCLALAAWLAVVDGGPLLVGGALALAMLGRPHVMACWPALAALALSADWRHAAARKWRIRAWIWRSAIPIGCAIAALLWYNHARFGDAFDFGYARQNAHPSLTQLQSHGQFNPRYAPRNLWTALLAPPVWRDGDALPTFDPQGLSLLITTPGLLVLVLGGWRKRLSIWLWVSVALTALPLVFYYNTGWMQFGWRFLLDLIVPLAFLVAFAAARAPRKLAMTLLGLGVLINAYGVWWWFRWAHHVGA